VGLWIKRGRPAFKKPSNQDLAAFGIFVLTALLRAVPALNRITGSVGDMTQHNDMTQIILMNDGFSKTYAPFYDFAHFGEYPLGFHTLSAILSQNTGLPFYRATQWISVLSFCLLHLGLYSFLRRKWSSVRAMSVSAIVLLLAHYPQFLNQWGSAPTALSTAFLFYAFYLLAQISENPAPSWPEKVTAGFVLAAGLLCHLIPPVGFAVYFPIWLIVHRHLGKEPLLPALKNLIPVFILGFILVLPFLMNFNFDVFDASKTSISSGHENSVARITDLVSLSNPAAKFLGDAAALFVFLIGPSLSAVALLFLLLSRDRAAKIEFLSFGAVFLVLYACFRFRWMPAYHLFQAERIHYFLLLPLAILIGNELKPFAAVILAGLWAAGGLESVKRNFESHYAAFRKDGRLLQFILRDASFGSYWAFACDRVNAGVTPEDLEAFKWIRENIDENAVFLVNYADAGHLIPSFTGRRITDPHGMDMWHGEELKNWNDTRPATHIYVGKNPSPAYPVAWTRGDKLLHNYGGASVYLLSKLP